MYGGDYFVDLRWSAVEHPSYPNPPITEAVVEIRFEGAIPESDRAKVGARLSEFYPNETKHVNQAIHVDVDAHSVQLTNKDTIFRRAGKDESEILLLSPNAFLVSQLAVYPGWDYFFGRFQRDWEVWRKAVGYRKVERIGVRFINRIDVPMNNGLAHHERYLNVYIHMPPQFDQIGDYGLQVHVPLHNIQCGAKINSASVPSPVPGFASFVLDIDIGRNIDVPQKDADIFAVLSEIRLAKNALFEASITDAARERFHDDYQLR